jgi:hypothetical protein
LVTKTATLELPYGDGEIRKLPEDLSLRRIAMESVESVESIYRFLRNSNKIQVQQEEAEQNLA